MKLKDLEEFEWIMDYKGVLRNSDLKRLEDLEVFELKDEKLFELPLKKVTIMISEMSRIVEKYMQE